MDGLQVPPMPPRPDAAEFQPKRRRSCLVVLAIGVGLSLAVLLSILMIGFIWPLVVGFAIFGVIALQYLLWGWWLGRLYRTPAVEDNRLPAHAFSLANLMMAVFYFSIAFCLLSSFPLPGTPVSE